MLSISEVEEMEREKSRESYRGVATEHMKPDPEKSANERQVGGDHYKHGSGEEHWDRIWRMYGPGYFVGSITKYVERYPRKNGVEDLKKARHFLDKLIELETHKESNTKETR